MYKIVISGWYGEKNLGDEIILQSMIETIKADIPNADISVLSFNPNYTKDYQTVNAVNHFPYTLKNLIGRVLRNDLFSIIEAYLTVKKADLIIIGGGGFLSDWNPKAIKPWLKQIYFFKCILKKKVMLYAIGAGPFLSLKYQKKTKKALDMVDSITVRDEESRTQLKKCGVHNVKVTADPAVSLIDRSTKLSYENGVRTIGLSIAPLFINSLWKNSNEKYNKYLQAFVDFINLVNKTYKDRLNLVFIPMQDEYDRTFNLEIINQINYRNNVSIIMDGETIDEKLVHLKGCDLIVGMRLHSIIISSTYGIPSLGVVYHHKVHEYLGRIGLKGLYVEVGDGGNWKDVDIDPEDMYEKFVTLYENINYYKEEVENSMHKMREINKTNIKEVKRLLGK
jgi:polysaccharide pyruvyl transferase WcaK-like protein